MDHERIRFFQDLLAGLTRRDPEKTLRALSGLLSDPENPDAPAQPRTRRAGRHRQWVASLGFSSLTGVCLSRTPKLEPLRMPLGFSLEYLFKDYGIHLMVFPMDFAPDSGARHGGCGPEPGGLPASASALALGLQVGILKLTGDHPWTAGVDLRFLPAPGEKRWQLSGFSGFHFPLVDLN